ncbi:MAG: NADH-quinone oxidoreductase subunit M, partial [Chloroflexi bacterium]
PTISVQAAPWIAGLAVVGILYGAAVSYAQRDMKKLVAYSSVSHLGFVMLGIFALNSQGIAGAILQMVNHGLSTGALFLIVGMLYERRHTRDMAAFGGVWKVMPVLGALALIVALSSAGLPGLNGFVGEFTILLGAFGSPAIGSPWFSGISALGVILAAVYLLVWFQRVFLGEESAAETARGTGGSQGTAVPALRDIHLREILILVPLLILIFWIGLYPKPFFDLINPTVEQLVATIQAAAFAAR